MCTCLKLLTDDIVVRVDVVCMCCNGISTRVLLFSLSLMSCHADEGQRSHPNIHGK